VNPAPTRKMRQLFCFTWLNKSYVPNLSFVNPVCRDGHKQICQIQTPLDPQEKYIAECTDGAYLKNYVKINFKLKINVKQVLLILLH
jgi:hypothetical protein